VQSPGAERIDDQRYVRTLHDYVTGVMTQFRSDDRVLGWDLWNEPDNPAREYAEVERGDKQEHVTEMLPQVFQWARSVEARQPLTSGVWEGSSSPTRGIQLANSDVVTFHCYDEPSAFEGRVAELSQLGRPMLCTEYMARKRGSTIEGVLPVAKRYNVGAINWGFVAGKTQTYLPWDSWDQPYTSVPRVWFHDLLRPDGRPHRNSEVLTISKLSSQSRAR
jgi:hypothetical protein